MKQGGFLVGGCEKMKESDDMLDIIKRHKLILFCTALLFMFVCYYYAAINPVLLRWGDDFLHFGTFAADPIPRIGRWNVTRLLPENLMPIMGYFSAFFIYPLAGDYLTAASIALAIVMGLFLSALLLSFYRLFISLYNDRTACTAVSIMIMGLCFAMFKSNASNNVHLFYAFSYILVFFFVIPNILNSVIVLTLMRRYIVSGKLAINANKFSGGGQNGLMDSFL